MTDFQKVSAAQKRIEPYIHQTPIFESHLLNQWLGSRIQFKAECLQITGAFKIRGAINVLAQLAESDALPNKIVANSSGNHAQAVAYAAKMFNIPATIYSAANVSGVKAAATRYYGAELKLFPTRIQADEAVAAASLESGTLWIPPFNHPEIIAGQGTLLADSIEQVGEIDAVFAPCGGGGLLSGTLLSARQLIPQAKVFGAEPMQANDAANSLRTGSIVKLEQPPITLADGAATPSVGTLTFPILQQLDGLYEVEEQQIAYWTQWLQHLLKLHVEPTSAMAMEAVRQWLMTVPENQNVLVLLSGGNIDQAKMQQIWQQDHLLDTPSLG